MTTRKGVKSVLPGQMALDFDVFSLNGLPEPVQTHPSTALDQTIRLALGDLLDRAFDKGQSRDRLANSLTDYLARPVSKAHLDQWAAPSQADRRITLDAWIALMDITSDYTPLELLAIHSQRRVLTVDEAICAQFGALNALEIHIGQQKRDIESRLDQAVMAKIVGRLHGQRGA